jgi:glutathione S-transferase
MAEITLHYFPIYGRAEPVRMLLHYHGVQFNDHHVQLQDWPGLKTSGFSEFGQLPLLEIDGRRLVQSKAILRYVAEKYGYYPTDPRDIYFVESLSDFKEDVLNVTMPLMFRGEAEAVDKWYQESAPTVLQKIERRLVRNEGGNKFFVGKSLSMADFQIFGLIYDLFIIRNRANLVQTHAPKVYDFIQRALTSARLKAYVDSRPPSHV